MTSPATKSITYSRGQSGYDNTPEQREASDFEAFCKAIYEDRVPATGLLAKGRQYICAPCAIAPDDDWHRQDKKARAIGSHHRCKPCSLPRRWLGFDVDGGLSPETFETLRIMVGRYSALIYTTASHTDEVPRIRIILELDSELTRNEAKAVSAWVRSEWSSELQMLGFAPPLWDRSVDRGEQPLFCPPSNAQFWRTRGVVLDTAAALAAAPPGDADEEHAPRILRELSSNPPSTGALLRLQALAERVTRAPVGQRNEALYQAAADAAKVNTLGEEEIETVLYQAGLEAGLDASEIHKTIHSGVDHGRTQECVWLAHEEFGDALAEIADDPLPPVRAQIELRAGELPTMIARCELAMNAAGMPLYSRGTMLIRARPVHSGDDDESKIRRPEGALILAKVGVIDLMTDMEASATFWRYEKRGRPKGKKSDAAAAIEAAQVVEDEGPKLVRVDAPERLAKAIVHNANKRQLPELKGLALAPVLRADNTIVHAPGYDRRTGLLLAIPKGWEVIPLNPTREDALRARDFIFNTALRTFPLKTAADRSVALAAIMTGVLRCNWVTGPMTIFSAPVAGTGKSKLVHIVSVVATGQTARMCTWGRSDEENTKLLTGIALAGDPVACLDNVNVALDSDLLCSMLTEPEVQLRILGATGQHTAPCRTYMLATGNNITVIGDLNRRVLVCTLDAGVERPELRQFASDVVEDVQRLRVQLVNAVHTIVLAHRLAHQPLGPLWSSYPEWCRDVRDPLIWLGEADPVQVTETQVAEDPDRQTLSAFLSSFVTLHGSRELQAGAIVGTLSGFGGDEDKIRAETTMSECLHTINRGSHGMPDVRRLGLWLKGRVDKPVDGLVLRGRINTAAKATMWRVERLDAW